MTFLVFYINNHIFDHFDEIKSIPNQGGHVDLLHLLLSLPSAPMMVIIMFIMVILVFMMVIMVFMMVILVLVVVIMVVLMVI